MLYIRNFLINSYIKYSNETRPKSKIEVYETTCLRFYACPSVILYEFIQKVTHTVFVLLLIVILSKKIHFSKCERFISIANVAMYGHITHMDEVDCTEDTVQCLVSLKFKNTGRTY
jgi:hypothetical protein